MPIIIHETNAVARTALGPIEYRERGDGPPVLLAHGTPGDSTQGMALARILALGGYRAIAPSRPGYSDTPIGVGRSPEEQADAYAAFLDALGIDRVSLISLSAGGFPAVAFALRYPERVRRLLLLQSVTARMDIATDDLLHAALLLPRSARLAPSVVSRSLRRREPRLIEAALTLGWSTLPLPARRDGIVNDSHQISRLPELPLGKIRTPTLLIHGTADQNVPYAQSVAAAAAIPNARLITLPGKDHGSALFARPVKGAVGAFLRRD